MTEWIPLSERTPAHMQLCDFMRIDDDKKQIYSIEKAKWRVIHPRLDMVHHGQAYYRQYVLDGYDDVCVTPFCPCGQSITHWRSCEPAFQNKKTEWKDIKTEKPQQSDICVFCGNIDGDVMGIGEWWDIPKVFYVCTDVIISAGDVTVWCKIDLPKGGQND